MTRIAIIAALPGELKPLVKGWKHEVRDRVHLWSGAIQGVDVIAACAGAGQACATRAFAAAESLAPVTLAISWGWVGALSEAFEPGHAYGCDSVIDLKTGERFLCDAQPFRTEEEAPETPKTTLVTSPRVADEAEKQRLAGTYRASLVDMEAAAVARLAAMRSIPFRCIKGVSDGFHDRLPDFNRFLGADGQMRMGRLILFAIFHPSCWPALIRMGENSNKAAMAMAAYAQQILPETAACRKRD